MTREEAFKLTPEISYVIFANDKYRVAYVAEEFGVTWIGIYDEPPSLHTDRIQAGHCEPSFPPAEGAELDHQHDHLLDHPEGAEEILEKHFHATPYKLNIAQHRLALFAMQEFATLHAQRIADKMVEENLVEFGDMIRDEPNGDIAALAEYFIRTINLKTREK